jgi:hypothetical protein
MEKDFPSKWSLKACRLFISDKAKTLSHIDKENNQERDNRKKSRRR